MRSKFINAIILLVIAVSFYGCTKVGSIHGVVKDAEGNLIENAQVAISPSVMNSMLTNSTGEFNFSDIDEALYTITVSKEGYETTSRDFTVDKGQTTSADFTLKEAVPELSVSPTSLDFGTSESSLKLYLTNEGEDVLTYNASSTDSWISITPSSGTITNQTTTMTINVNRTDLSVNTYNGTIVINTNSNSIIVNIVMTILPPGAPSVTSTASTNTTQTTAIVAGEITSIGSGTISSYGHCWSTSETPTINDTKTNFGSTSSAVTFSSILTQLEPNTIYYVRAYATNNVGTAYSSQISFTTTNEPSPPTVTTNDASNVT